MCFLIGQIFSVLALVISVVIAQFKEVKYVLIGEVASNLAVAFSFLFLGGLSGAWLCIVAAVQCIVMYFVNKRNMDDRKRNILLVIFGAIYIIGTIVVYKDWNDIVSAVCAILFVLSIVQTEAGKYRIFMALNSALWLIYDFNTAAYVNMITHGSLAISLLIAMYRLDWKRKGQKE